MPDSVPPAVSKAFAAIIPGVTGLYVSGTIYFLFQKFVGMPLIDWISETIQKPLIGLSQGYGAVYIYSIACSRTMVLWASWNEYNGAGIANNLWNGNG